VHGGIVQGIGQALLEHAVYDPDSGQLLSGSFMDYAMPRAGDIPPFAFSTHNVPSTANPLGVKGAGEAGGPGPAAAGTPNAARRRRLSTRSSTLSTVVLNCATSICQRRRAVYGKCSTEYTRGTLYNIACAGESVGNDRLTLLAQFEADDERWSATLHASQDYR